MRTFKALCQSAGANQRLFGRDHGPGVGGGRRLQHSPGEERPRGRRQQMEGDAGRACGLWREKGKVNERENDIQRIVFILYRDG